MKMFYVYKVNYCQYSEVKGSVIIAKDWQRAKGIAMVRWKDQNRNNVKVEEIDFKEGILCDTNYIINTDTYN